MGLSYRASFIAAIVVMVLLGVIGAIQVADPVKLGLSESFVEWLKIVAVGLGILNGFLPRVTKPPQDERSGLD